MCFDACSGGGTVAREELPQGLAYDLLAAALPLRVTDDVIKKYIELQDAEPQDDDKFRISG